MLTFNWFITINATFTRTLFKPSLVALWLCRCCVVVDKPRAEKQNNHLFFLVASIFGEELSEKGLKRGQVDKRESHLVYLRPQKRSPNAQKEPNWLSHFSKKLPLPVLMKLNWREKTQFPFTFQLSEVSCLFTFWAKSQPYRYLHFSCFRPPLKIHQKNFQDPLAVWRTPLASSTWA